jgi:hypothetical protein
MADKNTHPDATPAYPYTLCHSDRSPIGAKRRNLLQHPSHLPNRLSCREFIAIEPLFLPVDYFSVFFLSLGDAFSVAISFVPSCLRGQESIMQNKPNSLKPRTNATPCTAKIYEKKPLQHHSKKQTQTNPISCPQTIKYPASSIENLASPAHNTTSDIRHTTCEIQTQSPSAIRRRGPLRGNTQYAIPNQSPALKSSIVNHQ